MRIKMEIVGTERPRWDIVRVRTPYDAKVGGYAANVKLRVLITVAASAGVAWLLMRWHNQRSLAEAELWAEATDSVD